MNRRGILFARWKMTTHAQNDEKMVRRYELETEWIENLKNFLSHEAVCEIYTRFISRVTRINVESRVYAFRGIITKECNPYLFLFSKINVRLLFVKRLVRLKIFKFRDPKIISIRRKYS